MPDENNPIIYIEYTDEAFPPTNWQDIKQYAVGFNVKNSGTLKVSQTTLTLKNTQGRYTGAGSLTIQPNKLLRIRADVRGRIDTLFYGRVAPIESTNEKEKSEYLTVTARGMLQKLNNDSITHDYLEEQNTGAYDKSMKQVIEDFLEHPDSGEATGITLATNPLHTALANTKAKHNFDRESLLDAVKKIGEYVGYTGDEQVESGSDILMWFYPYGYVATYPYITIGQESDNLGNQVIMRKHVLDPDDIYNHICVKGGSSVNYPDSDRFTENAVAKGWWHVEPNRTVSDDSVNKQVNSNSVRIASVGRALVKATLHLTPSLGDNGLDVKAKKLTQLHFWILQSESLFYTITLIDIANREICYTPNRGIVLYPPTDWQLESISVGRLSSNNQYQTESIDSTIGGHGKWVGDTYFDWHHVTKIKFEGGTTFMNIDGLCFTGFIEADPRKDPTLAAIDANSINLYGRRVLQYEDPALKDYEAIKPLADKILESTKNPINKLIIKVGAKTWAKPNEYLTVNMPVYGISNQQYRIVELEFDWSTKTKLLRSTLSLTPRTQPVTSREWYASQLDGIIKNLIW